MCRKRACTAAIARAHNKYIKTHMDTCACAGSHHFLLDHSLIVQQRQQVQQPCGNQPLLVQHCSRQRYNGGLSHMAVLVTHEAQEVEQAFL